MTPRVQLPTNMRQIRRFARAVAEKFAPDKIILFGSHAYGTPDPDSDVDILVVKAARNDVAQAVRIRLAVEAPFPMDLLVRSPDELRRRLELGDSFMQEIVTLGKVLYEKDHQRMGGKGRGRLASLKKARTRQASPA